LLFAIPVLLIKGWAQSVALLVFISIYANVAGHFSAWQSSRVEVTSDEPRARPSAGGLHGYIAKPSRSRRTRARRVRRAVSTALTTSPSVFWTAAASCTASNIPVRPRHNIASWTPRSARSAGAARLVRSAPVLANYSPDPHRTALGDAIRAGAGGGNAALAAAIARMDPNALALLIAANRGKGKPSKNGESGMSPR
jgi:hypothetical protein